MPNANFGAGIAISDDDSTIAIGSPDAHDSSGMVQVHHLVDSKWVRKGGDIKPPSNIVSFGLRVGLSRDGDSLAIAAPMSDAPKSKGVGALFVYDWDSTAETWKDAIVKYGKVDTPKLGLNGITTDPINLLLHAVDENNKKHSFKVR